MRTSEVASLLEKTIPNGQHVLLVGAPGVGKTDLVRSGCKQLRDEQGRWTPQFAADGYGLIISHPVVSDPTDFKGLPVPDLKERIADWLPFGDLLEATRVTRRTVWLLDDLGQAPAAVQAACMQLMLGGGLNGHRISPLVTFVACTNRREDRAGVTGILEPVKSRFTCIVHIEADIRDWEGWAVTSGFIPAEMVAFLRSRPDLLCDFKATAEITNSPCPRTWANCARLQALNLPENIRDAAFAGAVGQGAATEYSAFLGMYGTLVTADQIMMDPQNAAIPTKPSELFAVSTALGFRANERNFDRIASYLERMTTSGYAEFAVLAVRDGTRRHSELLHTDGYRKLIRGQLGQILFGETG